MTIMMQSRREFLKYFISGAGCFIAKAYTFPLPNTLSVTGRTDFTRFPQGIASADPQEDAVMLWVRAVPKQSETETVNLIVQVCEDGSFDKLVLQSNVSAEPNSDHTVRFFAWELQSDHIYYYRFITDEGVSSPVGRTRTAPIADADRRVNFAWVSCQNYEQGFYGAWERMLYDDMQADDDEKLDFILHVGDFIYESLNAGFQDKDTRSLYGDSLYLKDRAGRERRLPPFPSGGSKGKYGGWAAVDLQDYRHLYREYLKDPHLQAARARWPFICIWDDHEFGDNCWQSHLDRDADQKGRLAANQAWFEYVPALLTQSPPVDGVESQAYDFQNTSVRNVPFGEPGEATADKESNNQAVIQSIGVYRSLRYGRHLKLIITDNRLYRSDHAIPEWWEKMYFSDRPLLKTATLISALDQLPEQSDEMINNNGIFAPNPRKTYRPGSILGSLQKKWWKQSIKNTNATWKIWANSVPLMSLVYQNNNADSDQPLYSLHSDDSWDGYPTEKHELLQFIHDEGINNVVSLSGDLHAHIVGMADEVTEVKGEKYAIAEFVVSGISSMSMYRTLRLITPNTSLFYDEIVGSEKTNFPLLNNTIMNGGRSSLEYDATGRTGTYDSPNPHLVYVDTDATGYGLVRLDDMGMHVSLVTMANPLSDSAEKPDKIMRKVHYYLKDGSRKPQFLSIIGKKPYLT